MVASPMDSKDRPKSYFLGGSHHNVGKHHEERRDRLGNHSVRVDQRKKSKEKDRSKNRIDKKDINVEYSRDITGIYGRGNKERTASQGHAKSNKKVQL